MLERRYLNIEERKRNGTGTGEDRNLVVSIQRTFILVDLANVQLSSPIGLWDIRRE
jgi:hypothetical protein